MLTPNAHTQNVGSSGMLVGEGLLLALEVFSFPGDRILQSRWDGAMIAQGKIALAIAALG